MRLSPNEVATIKAATAHTFGPQAVVRLFGSRVRDDLRGGDIDLHVTLVGPDTSPSLKHVFRARLFEALGERWPDVVTTVGEPQSAIERIALRDGIVL